VPKASANDLRPQESKVKEVRDLAINEDSITVDVESDSPVSFLDNPEEIIPHDKIPHRIATAIIETYGETYFRSRDWDRSTLKRLHKAITHPRENLTNTIAQICSPDCPLKDRCPHDIVGRAPVGERCPIELKMAQWTYEEYVVAVSERLQRDPDEIKEDIILHNLISGLVESDMIENRLNGFIAHDGFITDVATVVNEETGQVYYKQEESAIVRIKERVSKRKDQLYRQLLATPEMAERYKKSDKENAYAKAAEALDKLLSTAQLRIKAADADFTTDDDTENNVDG